MRLQIITQNMTEGPVTDALRDGDILLLEEVDRDQLESGLGDHMETFLPKRAPGCAIAWNTAVVTNVKTGALRFHGRGKAEGWDFKSPPRGMAWITCDIDGVPCAFFVVWLLNSWAPVRPDRWTLARRRVVSRLALPRMRSKIRQWQKEGRLVFGGGDGNSIMAPLHFRGLWQPWKRGLDRIWLPKGIRARRKFETPKTGVGNQMRHHGRAVEVDFSRLP